MNKILASLLCVAALFASDICEAQDNATSPLRPQLILSFFASIDNNAIPMANLQARGFDLSGNTLMSIGYRDDIIAQEIVKNTLWIPYLKSAYERKLGVGSVILDPLNIKIDSEGNLIVESKLEPELAAHRILWLSYEAPQTTASMGPMRPSTLACVIAPVSIEISRNTLPGKVIPYAKLMSFLNENVKVSHSKKISDKLWQSVLGVDGAIDPNMPIPVLETVATNDFSKYKLSIGDASRQYKDYASILGIQSQSTFAINLTKSLLSAETKFRTYRDNDFIKYFTSGEYGRSIRSMADTEYKVYSQMGNAYQTAMLSSVIAGGGSLSGGLSGASLLSSVSNAIQQSNSTLSSMSATGHAEAQASAHISEVHVAVASNQISLDQDVSAKTIDELRKKFSSLAKKVLANEP